MVCVTEVREIPTMALLGPLHARCSCFDILGRVMCWKHGGSQNQGYHYSILGSILGSAYCGKLPHPFLLHAHWNSTASEKRGPLFLPDCSSIIMGNPLLAETLSPKAYA